VKRYENFTNTSIKQKKSRAGTARIYACGEGVAQRLFDEAGSCEIFSFTAVHNIRMLYINLTKELPKYALCYIYEE